MPRGQLIQESVPMPKEDLSEHQTESVSWNTEPQEKACKAKGNANVNTTYDDIYYKKCMLVLAQISPKCGLSF